MSWQAMQFVIDEVPLIVKAGPERPRSGAVHTMLVLARHAEPDGTCAWPTVSTMAKKTLRSARAVHEDLRWLVRAGLVEVEPNPRSPGWHALPANHRPVSYRILYTPSYSLWVANQQALKGAREH